MVVYRPIDWSEIGLLEDFLYLAVHQNDPDDPIPREVIRDPRLAAYIDGWGRRRDLCLVAVVAEKAVGAAWARNFDGDTRGYGTVDELIPEIVISVKPAHRGRGIGSELMVQLVRLIEARGDERVSLSVQKANPALRLYRRLGFAVAEDHGDEYVMVLDVRGRAQP